LDRIKKGIFVSKIAVNKTDLIEAMAEASSISKVAAGKALSTFLDSIIHTLQAGQSISLLGFGTFGVKPRAARIGRNPKTGEPIQIGAANIPSFKAGKALKDAVNCGTSEVDENQPEKQGA
jgi:DNA-binding protein HU-beta